MLAHRYSNQLRTAFRTRARLVCHLINYGAIIQSTRQPDKQNQLAEITLGYDDLQGRLNF